jgi:hypothetical protein
MLTLKITWLQLPHTAVHCLQNIQTLQWKFYSQLKQIIILQLNPNLRVVVFCPMGKAVPDISKKCKGFKTSRTIIKWQWHVSEDQRGNYESCVNTNLLSLLL